MLDAHDSRHVLVRSAIQLGRVSRSGRHSVKDARNGGLVLDSAFLREMPIATTLLSGSGSAELSVPHLEQRRPEFASRTRIQQLHTYVPPILVFDRVAGAILEGDAPEGSRVTARAVMQIQYHFRRFEAWTVAYDWRFRIRVPVPTRSDSRGGMQTGPSFEVRAGTFVARIIVPEDAVDSGSTIRVDSWTTAPAPQ